MLFGGFVVEGEGRSVSRDCFIKAMEVWRDWFWVNLDRSRR